MACERYHASEVNHVTNRNDYRRVYKNDHEYYPISVNKSNFARSVSPGYRSSNKNLVACQVKDDIHFYKLNRILPNQNVQEWQYKEYADRLQATNEIENGFQNQLTPPAEPFGHFNTYAKKNYEALQNVEILSTPKDINDSESERYALNLRVTGNPNRTTEVESLKEPEKNEQKETEVNAYLRNEFLKLKMLQLTNCAKKSYEIHQNADLLTPPKDSSDSESKSYSQDFGVKGKLNRTTEVEFVNEPEKSNEKEPEVSVDPRNDFWKLKIKMKRPINYSSPNVQEKPKDNECGDELAIVEGTEEEEKPSYKKPSENKEQFECGQKDMEVENQYIVLQPSSPKCSRSRKFPDDNINERESLSMPYDGIIQNMNDVESTQRMYPPGVLENLIRKPENKSIQLLEKLHNDPLKEPVNFIVSSNSTQDPDSSLQLSKNFYAHKIEIPFASSSTHNNAMHSVVSRDSGHNNISSNHIQYSHHNTSRNVLRGRGEPPRYSPDHSNMYLYPTSENMRAPLPISNGVPFHSSQLSEYDAHAQQSLAPHMNGHPDMNFMNHSSDPMDVSKDTFLSDGIHSPPGSERLHSMQPHSPGDYDRSYHLLQYPLQNKDRKRGVPFHSTKLSEYNEHTQQSLSPHLKGHPRMNFMNHPTGPMDVSKDTFLSDGIHSPPGSERLHSIRPHSPGAYERGYRLLQYPLQNKDRKRGVSFHSSQRSEYDEHAQQIQYPHLNGHPHKNFMNHAIDPMDVSKDTFLSDGAHSPPGSERLHSMRPHSPGSYNRGYRLLQYPLQNKVRKRGVTFHSSQRSKHNEYAQQSVSPHLNGHSHMNFMNHPSDSMDVFSKDTLFSDGINSPPGSERLHSMRPHSPGGYDRGYRLLQYPLQNKDRKRGVPFHSSQRSEYDEYAQQSVSPHLNGHPHMNFMNHPSDSMDVFSKDTFLSDGIHSPPGSERLHPLRPHSPGGYNRDYRLLQCPFQNKDSKRGVPFHSSQRSEYDEYAQQSVSPHLNGHPHMNFMNHPSDSMDVFSKDTFLSDGIHSPPGSERLHPLRPHSPGGYNRDYRLLQCPFQNKDSKTHYECNVCRKTFLQLSNLRVHQRTHSGERPFKCNMCFKTFIQEAHLKRHHFIHTGEKPHQCGICKKRFSLRCNLKAHLKTHSGQKPYSCNQCGGNFTKLFHLKRHKQKVCHAPDVPQKMHHQPTHWKTASSEPNAVIFDRLDEHNCEYSMSEHSDKDSSSPAISLPIYVPALHTSLDNGSRNQLISKLTSSAEIIVSPSLSNACAHDTCESQDPFQNLFPVLQVIVDHPTTDIMHL